MDRKFNSQSKTTVTPNNAEKTAHEIVGAWLAASEQYRNLTAQILREHRMAGRKLAATAVNLPYSQPRWTLLPLPSSAGILLAARARYARTSQLHNEFDAFLKLLNDGGARSYRDYEAFNGPQFAHNPRARKQADLAGKFLMRLSEEGKRIHFSPDAVDLSQLQQPEEIPNLRDALAENFNLAALLSIVDNDDDTHSARNQPESIAAPPGSSIETTRHERDSDSEKFDAMNIDAADLADLPQIIAQLDALATELSECRSRCIQLACALREKAALQKLEKTDLTQLNSVSWQTLKLNLLQKAGITNVGQLLDGSRRIHTITGIGEKTSHAIMAAAHTLQREIFAETPARINPKAPTPEAVALIQGLSQWERVQHWLGQENRSVLAFASALKPRMHQLTVGIDRIIIVGRGRAAKDFLTYIDAARKLAAQYATLSAPIHTVFTNEGADDSKAWQDFAERAAFFYAQMAEMGIPTSETKRIAGELPTQVVEQVQATPLNTNLLKVPLRGYQNFGARFIRAQEKVILGDEMGLGKTLEALAVAADLCEGSNAHITVICPAAVVTNWLREIASKTRLHAYRLHGIARLEAANTWLQLGGIAVTTYESLGWFLQWLADQAPADFTLSYVISDEAHYVKNEDAKRSKRTSYLLSRARQAVLLTGTPMENNPEEFRTLIRYIHPHIADMQALRPVQFRRRVAPIYLRRTQEDVLEELPDLIETEVWVNFSPEDSEIYDGAVRDGNFMAMRQAAMASPQSAKIAQLKEILAEAKANGRKAIVYSYFLRPLQLLRECLLSEDSSQLHIIGPLTGAISPDRRQKMVDELTSAAPGAVLLAQISAGGIGLNIQAANVVIICEPQLKPTIEWQAIARSHRMGQTSTVHVYRLLSEHGVDLELHRRLARKASLFGEFADISETANAKAAADIITTEKARLQSTNTQTDSPQLATPLPVNPQPADAATS